VTDDALDAEIMQAHEDDDRSKLAHLYYKGAQLVLAKGATDHGCFLMTQAMVYGLDAGVHQVAIDARKTLIQFGREE
jgi:hypothetical protein